MIKTFLIPVAAFAVTVTGASAFNSDMLRRAGLTDEQVSAFEQAKELRQSGDTEAARDVLVAAGIDESVMGRVRAAMGESSFKFKHGRDSEVQAAIEANDYSAFRLAIAGSPLSDIINSEAEFALFVEAHNHIKAGDRDSAKAIMEDLGITKDKKHDGKKRGPWGGKDPAFMASLSEEQRVELKAAFEARDHEKVREIMEAAGIEKPGKGKGFGLGLGLKAKVDAEAN